MSGYATIDASIRAAWDASIARQVKRTRRETLEEVEKFIADIASEMWKPEENLPIEAQLIIKHAHLSYMLLLDEIKKLPRENKD